jgi:hypothetical protein
MRGVEHGVCTTTRQADTLERRPGSSRLHGFATTPQLVSHRLRGWNFYNPGGRGGSAFGATNEGGPLGGRPVPRLTPSDVQGVRVLVHSGTIRLDSASSNRNSPRFAGDRTLPTRVTSPPAMELYSARGGPPWGVTDFPPPWLVDGGVPRFGTPPNHGIRASPAAGLRMLISR